MAQETGVFSIRRPREPLGGIAHNPSAIPMPASAMKRSNSVSNMQNSAFGGPFTTNHARSTSGSRMSLAPGRPSQPIFQRSSSGDNLAGMGGFQSAHRNSTNNMFGGASTGRKSLAPGAGLTTPASALSQDQSSQRRSSVFRARPSSGAGGMGQRQSFFTTTPATAAMPVDPRRLKDASVRAQMAQELMEYLTHGNFEMEAKHSLTHKSMSSPTQKDFNCMFQWLYHRIDPAYRFQKSIDAEVPALLKQLRYPFEKSIMKSQIAAVGGNNWSTFLGLLHWMMQLARMMDQYNAGSYDDVCAEAGHDVLHDRIIFDFLSDAYQTWLHVEDDGEDDDPAKLVAPHVEVMAAKFEQANSHHLEELEVLQAEHKALEDQIDELGKSGPRLNSLNDQIKILEEDKAKFEKYNDNLEGKVERYENRVKLLEEEIRKTEAELEEAENEKQSLQEIVDSRGITISDIDRMNTERERLQKGVESTSARLEETRKKVAEKEIEALRKLDELERTVEKYNSLGYQIGIIPATAANAKGLEYEIVITTNDGPNFSGSQVGASQGQDSSDRLLADSGNGYQPHQLLNLDLRGTVKTNILSLRKEISERRNAALEADMNNHDLLDKIKEAMDDKQSEVEGLGHKVRAAEEEFEKTREITNAQKMASDAQIEKMEKELAKMRAGLSDSVQVMEQREMSTNLEYEQLTLRAASLREELHTEIERMLNDIIKFKVHIQTHLEGYETFVSDEAEKCLEEPDPMGVHDDEDVFED
ncbi:HEC/Ndc80p family protein-like protein [Mytilinidion resinicola]|uniref:Kinetochore protein NDC80 n=1 Tax=Mytilinidion resinicola TaxID=574789 RepID=A0A6A6Y4Z9_9PEZI|nr:HEC/Ndc80p family protein-like protein [Mytilinidion resinicola]KAF2803699.1 HEC/Ndc80p family protein-like protein [Mytilinidion resinicola]